MRRNEENDERAKMIAKTDVRLGTLYKASIGFGDTYNQYIPWKDDDGEIYMISTYDLERGNIGVRDQDEFLDDIVEITKKNGREAQRIANRKQMSNLSVRLIDSNAKKFEEICYLPDYRVEKQTDEHLEYSPDDCVVDVHLWHRPGTVLIKKNAQRNGELVYRKIKCKMLSDLSCPRPFNEYDMRELEEAFKTIGEYGDEYDLEEMEAKQEKLKQLAREWGEFCNELGKKTIAKQTERFYEGFDWDRTKKVSDALTKSEEWLNRHAHEVPSTFGYRYINPDDLCIGPFDSPTRDAVYNNECDGKSVIVIENNDGTRLKYPLIVWFAYDENGEVDWTINVDATPKNIEYVITRDKSDRCGYRYYPDEFPEMMKRYKFVDIISDLDW